jgi:hypothetical protein
MRSFFRLTALASVLTFAAQPAASAAEARTFDLVTLKAPKGFTAVEKPDGGGRLELTKASSTSYCIVALYASTPASKDLDASFAAEWQGVVLKTVDAVRAPKPVTRDVGGTQAAVGSASSTVGGQPVWTRLHVLDAGASVLSILVMSPNEASFAAYEKDVEKMLNGMTVNRVEPAAAGAPQIENGRLVVPPASRALTIADLAGDWGHNDGITTSYVDRYTGAHAGTDSIHFKEKWTITGQGGISLDFFGIRNGKKIAEKSNGTVALSNGILVIRMTNMQQYVVRGWLELPDMTIMVLNGPWYEDGVPADVLGNPEKGTNLDKNWVRKK